MRYYLMFLLVFITNTIFAVTDNGSNVVWTAVFSNMKPISTKISEEYCKIHTPSVIVTTVKQITSKDGVNSLNGVNIRYLSYKGIDKDNLHFNIVDGILSGADSGVKWSQKIKLYEQTLDDVGVTYTVWSTPYCKGTFIGYPTVKQ